MKTAIVGSSGYISGYLLKRFENVLKIDQTPEADAYLNLAEAEKFDYSVLDCVNYVIFTAAISGPDICANEFEKCWKINVTGTELSIEKSNCLWLQENNSISMAVTPARSATR